MAAKFAHRPYMFWKKTQTLFECCFINSWKRKIIFSQSWKMYHPRYFENQYKDFEGKLENCDFLKQLVPNILERIRQRFPPLAQNADGGLYVGAVGAGYAFYAIANKPEFQERREEYLKTALDYIQVALKECSKENPRRGGIGASFLLGHAGVYAVSALVYNSLGFENERNQCIQNFLEMHKICLPISFFQAGSDELFVGRAGYLCGAMLLNMKFGRPVVPKEITKPLFDTIVESGKQYSRHYHSRSPLMYAYYGTEYLGAGHGLSSILQMLLGFPDYFSGQKEVESVLQEAVNFTLRCENTASNYPPTPGERHDDRNELVHWCHGAPGVVYLLVKAYLVWKDEKYLQAALRCGDLTWQKGLLRKGPGICHGVAGSGYVFLLLYRLTSDPKHLYRAQKFAEFMQTDEFNKGARTPDSPFSLYEGLAGTVCFYADLLQPSTAAFPFFDVFP